MEDKNIFIKSIMYVCPMCGKQNFMRMKKEQSKQYGKYQCYGGKIQDICVSFDAYGREFIKSGYCPKCQNMLFRTELPMDINSRFIEVTEDMENHINNFYSCRENVDEIPNNQLTSDEKALFLYFEGIEDRYYVDENGEIKEFEYEDGAANE